MPFDKEFQHHLHEVMVAASLQVSDEIEQRKRELIFKAQQTHNGAAMPIAYSDAAIYALKTRTQRVIDGYFQALDDCGILIDADVERELLKIIGSLTSTVHPLTFPPGLASRRGLDFTAMPYSAAEFERLLRTLHGEEIQAPALGPKPVFRNASLPSLSIPAQRNVGEGPAHRLALGDELNDAERELLDAAVHDSSGQISHRRPIGPDQLFANGRNFIETGNTRSSAKWLGALESLERKGLIRATSYEKHFYAVTNEGYDLADQLGPFVRWTTSEVVLQAFYLGSHAPESLTLGCSGLIEVPPAYYQDQYGADGGLMRSLKQRRGLLVEGIDPQALASLNFEPTDLEFEDAATQTKQQFRVAGRAFPDRRTLLLELED